jgi:putative transposase
LQERRWDGVDLLVIYIDGQRFGDQHVITAVGVDRTGDKHVLGTEIGATENAAAVKKLLVGLRDRGLRTRPAIPVRDRWRQGVAGRDRRGVWRGAAGAAVSKPQNADVLEELPREQHAQVRNVMRAAWKLTDAEAGIKRLESLARFLEHEYESAARSLREGMADMSPFKG